jgi:small subunit ribosomal protein S2
MSATVTMRDMLEAGAHYGHQCRRWNPKMKKYIFGNRNGVHIIDLQKTVKKLKEALAFVEDVVSNRGSILFVGTKRQARDYIRDEAKRCGMYYMNYRWLGGTMTNYKTIRQSINHLKKLEKMSEDGTYDKLTKKEVLNLERQREKLEKNLGGIKDMKGLPQAIFVSDAHKEHIAVLEAKKLGISVVALTDTNSDPDNIDYVIPGNDDSLKSINLFTKAIADAVLVGKTKQKAPQEVEEQKAEAGSFYDSTGHSVKVVKK